VTTAPTTPAGHPPTARRRIAVPDGGLDALLGALAADGRGAPVFVYERVDPVTRTPLVSWVGLRARVDRGGPAPFDDLRARLSTLGAGSCLFAFVAYPDRAPAGSWPTAMIVEPESHLRLDHVSGHGELVAPADEIEGWARCVDTATSATVPAVVDADRVDDWAPALTVEEYAEAVARLHDPAREPVGGVVLSVPMVSPTRTDALASYRALRSAHPSPRMFLLRTDEVALWGATSLPMVEVQGRHLVAETDGATHAVPALRDGEVHVWTPSAKEIDEYEVVAQALWQDLRPVTTSESLRFTRQREERRFSGLGHLFAEVRGELADGVDQLAVVEALFPHGAAVGHPRAAALDLIAELEPLPRGPFAGLVGVFDGEGGVDTASVTRSMWTTPAGSSTQAGAKVVPASVPDEEYQESVRKTRAVRESARALQEPTGRGAGC
jgi:anthranilate synthase component 1